MKERIMPETSVRLIAIDDEPNILLSITSCLTSEYLLVDTFDNTADAFFAMQRQVYDCALIDIRIGEESGIELFKNMRQADINTPVIFISGNASLNEAVESQKLGAYDFIEKPFSSDKLKITIENCLNFYRLQSKLTQLQNTAIENELVGDQPSMRELKTQIAKVANTQAAVLIQGESGTGKELIARAIHNASQRANFELVTVNCSAIPRELVESALFGHKKGAFTGASESRKGYFELAHKGTIFLDEIGDMPLAAQTSLLRVLETREIQKVGAESPMQVDVRVIAATHKDLKKMVEAGEFRQDLFYRIQVIPLYSPPLRERLSDLEQLVEHLIVRLCKRHGLTNKSFSDECLESFNKYPWPGNVRELTNTLERMIIMSGDRLTANDIPMDIKIDKADKFNHIENELNLKDFRAKAERELIVSRLNQFDGNISQVARSLDINRAHLHKKINQYEIQRDKDFR